MYITETTETYGYTPDYKFRVQFKSGVKLIDCKSYRAAQLAITKFLKSASK